MAAEKAAGAARNAQSSTTGDYKHDELAVLRPDVGVQAEFRRTFRTPARPSRRIFLTHIRLDIARDFWHATLQRAG
jgi:2-hydroxychromene-2-carboxylate isomerase